VPCSDGLHTLKCCAGIHYLGEIHDTDKLSQGSTLTAHVEYVGVSYFNICSILIDRMYFHFGIFWKKFGKNPDRIIDIYNG